MNSPLPEEERRAKARASRQAWWEAHPNYKAEWYAANADRIRERNREYMREYGARQSAAKQHRKRESERVGEWAKKNPEKVKATRERYKERNPEKVRAQKRDYYHRNKEAIKARRDALQGKDPEKLRESRRKYAANRASNPDSGWKANEEQQERYRAQSREKRQLERRLKAAGLPPRMLHPTLAAERRLNDATADAFFSRARSRAEIRRLARGDVAPSLIEGWARYSTLVRRRNEFLRDVRAYLAAQGNRLAEDAQLDSRAREFAGKPPLDIDAEVRRRAVEAVRIAHAGLPPNLVKLPKHAPRALSASTAGERATGVARESDHSNGR